MEKVKLKRTEMKVEDIEKLIMFQKIINDRKERARKKEINKLKQILLLNEEEIEKMKMNSGE